MAEQKIDWKEFDNIGLLTHWLNTHNANVIAAFQVLHGNYRVIYTTDPLQHYGYWQLCPKCDGEDQIPGFPDSTSAWRTCPVCNGAKILVRPEIKNNQQTL